MRACLLLRVLVTVVAALVVASDAGNADATQTTTTAAHFLAYDLGSRVVANVTFDVAGDEIDAWQALRNLIKEGRISAIYRYFGAAPVVSSISGVEHDFKTNGWCFSASSAKGWRHNIALEGTAIGRGDTMLFRLLPFKQFPTAGLHSDSSGVEPTVASDADTEL